MFLENRNISSKIKRSKVTDYAALIDFTIVFTKTLKKSYFSIDVYGDIAQELSRKSCKILKLCSYKIN